jgi:hypothetical protein
MALEIDGFAVMRSIGSHGASFPTIAADLVKAARTLVVKEIRHKNTGLKALRGICAALGQEAFALITDGMPDAQISSLASKLDKNNPELKTGDPASRRRHVLLLATGSVEPLERTKAPPKTEKVKKPRAAPSTPERISYASAGATRSKR